ncbi:hypothetical protein Moror_2601 [Moniliophthora roreri MCA 2997]|uniref:Uncharacterized protein n=1 Tax=Moniliophthora roreri (strain MCA 2997) TaxID=1381753 RepID=V2XG87_MONRO|nr:hypothetical protein Moror_2601 [Moniliophthora roreri MCA 2997]
MSSANAQNTPAPTAFNLHSRPLSLRPVSSCTSSPVHSKNVYYTGPFSPSPFELLYLVNTSEHNEALQRGTVASPILRITIDGSIPDDIRNADPNSPEFWMAHATYAE